MSNIINGRNYTYRLEDKIFNSQTTFYFTENAYYYTYSKDNSDLGYASDSNGKVFEFHIDENGIVPGEFLKNSNGEVITRLWEDAIVSFEDFRLDTLSNEANENNICQRTFHQWQGAGYDGWKCKTMACRWDDANNLKENYN